MRHDSAHLHPCERERGAATTAPTTKIQPPSSESPADGRNLRRRSWRAGRVRDEEGWIVHETYRMLGAEHEADLHRDALESRHAAEVRANARPGDRAPQRSRWQPILRASATLGELYCVSRQSSWTALRGRRGDAQVWITTRCGGGSTRSTGSTRTRYAGRATPDRARAVRAGRRARRIPRSGSRARGVARSGSRGRSRGARAWRQGSLRRLRGASNRA